MDELESKICFKRSLRVLFKLYTFFGLVNFTYNRKTNRVEPSTLRRCVLLFVLGYCGFRSLLLTLIETTAFLVYYWLTDSSKFISSEEFLLSVRLIFKIFNAFAFIVSYCTHKGTIVGTLNRVIALSERVQKLTNEGGLYYPRRFQKIIALRLVLIVLVGLVQSSPGTVLAKILSCLWFVDSFIVMELTFWSHLYGNLALMCFYQKMNHRLSVLCATASHRKLKRRIREMISVSYEIHRVKEKFNDAFTSLHAVSFLGLFSDISSLYKLLKLFLITGLDKVHMPFSKVVELFFLISFSGCWASYSLYLNGVIAEGLMQTEGVFRGRLLTMFCANDNLGQDPDQRREIDLVLMYHNIQDLATRSFHQFVIDRSFLFEFLRDIVVTYAILSLQQFAGDYVSASGQRLELLRRSVTYP